MPKNCCPNGSGEVAKTNVICVKNRAVIINKGLYADFTNEAKLANKIPMIESPIGSKNNNLG